MKLIFWITICVKVHLTLKRRVGKGMMNVMNLESCCLDLREILRPSIHLKQVLIALGAFFGLLGWIVLLALGKSLVCSFYIYIADRAIA